MSHSVRVSDIDQTMRRIDIHGWCSSATGESATRACSLYTMEAADCLSKAYESILSPTVNRFACFAHATESQPLMAMNRRKQLSRLSARTCNIDPPRCLIDIDGCPRLAATEVCTLAMDACVTLPIIFFEFSSHLLTSEVSVKLDLHVFLDPAPLFLLTSQKFLTLFCLIPYRSLFTSRLNVLTVVALMFI